MGVPIIYNYDINANVFLDSRKTIDSLNTLKYISSQGTILYPSGFEVFCIQEGAYYINTATNDNTPVWKLRMIDDETPSFISTYSSQKISQLLEQSISVNDETPSSKQPYSSQKVESIFDELRQETTRLEDDLIDIEGRVNYLEGKMFVISNFDGSYESLIDKPDIPDLEYYATKQYVTDEIFKIGIENYATKQYVTDEISRINMENGTGNVGDLTDYAKKSEIPTKVSQLTNDRGYLTSVPDEYITDIEILNMGFLTEHQSLTDYAKKTEVPKNTSELTNDAGFLTSVPDEYVTENELKAKGYLTEHQSLDGYVRTEELHFHSNKAILDGINMSKISSWDNKSNFSGSYDDLTNKPTIPTITNDLTNTLKSNYDKAYIHSQTAHFSGNYNDLTNKPTIPTIQGYATEEYVDNAVAEVDVREQLDDFAIKSDIPTKTSDLTNDSNFLIEHQSLDEYAKKTELHTHSNKAILDGINISKISSWDNKSNFSGNYNDLTNKPTIPTKTSELTNDSGYITSIPSEYVTDSELTAKGYATKDYVDNTVGYYNFLLEGGVADGVTDNSPMLQRLVNELSANGGGTIFIPKGEYFFYRNSGVNDICVYTKPNVSIIGAGMGKTILKCGRSTDTSLYALFGDLDLSVVKSNMTFSYFTVDMSAMSSTNEGYSHKGKAFYMQNVYNCVFRDLELIGTPSTALGIDFLDEVTIDNVNCTNCGRLWVKSSGQINEGPGGAGIGIGTGYREIENVKVVNCTCRDCGHYGIFFEHQSMFDSDLCTQISKGVIISNNIVTGSRGYGIGVRGGKNYTISNNQVYGCELDGIQLDSGEHGLTHETMFLENIIIIGNTSGENGYDGITIRGNARCGNISIKNNLCYSNTNYGIGIGSKAQAQRVQKEVIIQGNDIIGNGGDIFIQDNIEYGRYIVKDNTYINNTHSPGKTILKGAGYLKAPSFTLDSYNTGMIMYCKLPNNITEKRCLISNRDESYKDNGYVKGFSFCITTDYKFEITYCETNDGAKNTLLSTEPLPAGTKLYLKVDVLNKTVSYSINGADYSDLTFDNDITTAFSWIFNNLVNEYHTIGREWSGFYDFSKYFIDLVIYSIYTYNDSNNMECLFVPTMVGVNKPMYDLKQSGYYITSCRNTVTYLNEPM